MRRLAPLFAPIVALGLAACGAGGAGDDDDSTGDAGTGCGISLTWNPPDPVAGQLVDVTADVFGTNGFLEYTWSVDHGGPVPYDIAAGDGSRITFTPPDDMAGPYYVSVEVDGDFGTCYEDATINVRDPAATDTPWRIRFRSPMAPPQERIVLVPSGGDWDLDEIPLDEGATITGVVRDSGGTGVPAYLRLTPSGTPDLIVDGWAGTGGAFSISTTLTHQDLLVIPFRADLPSMILTDWTPTSGDIVVTSGVVVTGTVLDPDGAALAGATVSLTVDGVPSTVGISDAAGDFSINARPASPGVVEVDVAPPEGSGLPRLATNPAILDLSQPLAIHYQPTVASRNVGGMAIRQGGVSVPNAQVTFTGAVSGAATVSDGLSTAAAAGSFAITVVASGAGVLPDAQIPAAAGTAVVEPASGAAGILAVDLTGAAPATLDAPAGATLAGRVVDLTGAPVALADLRAVPSGALAATQLDQIHVSAGVDGTFTLPVAGGGEYELTILDPTGENALLRTPIGTASTNLGDIALPDGLELRGFVRVGGQSGLYTAITIFCESCTDDARLRPAAECSTGGTGSFQATLVDPGVP